MICTDINPEILITVRITIKKSSTNFTDVTFTRRKKCLDRTQQKPIPIESTISTGNLDLSTIAVSVTSFVCLSIILLLTCLAFCTRASPKQNPIICTNARNSSFQRFRTYSASNSPAASLKKETNSESEELHRRIVELTVQRCRVRLSNLIQEGTFGRVYRGTYNDWQEVLVKTVAVHANQTQVSMLLQEGISLYGASHTGILSVLGVCLEDHTTPFLLYPAPNGTQNLKLFLQEPISRTLTTIQIVNMSSQLVSALIHLHSHGVVHRDIAARNCV